MARSRAVIVPSRWYEGCPTDDPRGVRLRAPGHRGRPRQHGRDRHGRRDGADVPTVGRRAPRRPDPLGGCQRRGVRPARRDRRGPTYEARYTARTGLREPDRGLSPGDRGTNASERRMKGLAAAPTCRLGGRRPGALEPHELPHGHPRRADGDAADFGAFSLAFAVYVLVLVVSRGLTGEPLVVRHSHTTSDDWHRATAGLRASGWPSAWHSSVVVLVIGRDRRRDARRSVRRARHRPAGPRRPGRLAVRVRRPRRPMHAFVCDLAWAAILLPGLLLLDARAAPVARLPRSSCGAGLRLISAGVGHGPRPDPPEPPAGRRHGSARAGTWASATPPRRCISLAPTQVTLFVARRGRGPRRATAACAAPSSCSARSRCSSSASASSASRRASAARRGVGSGTRRPAAAPLDRHRR